MNEKKIAPHIPVIDKCGRDDGSLSRQDFTFDKQRNVYVCRKASYCVPPAASTMN